MPRAVRRTGPRQDCRDHQTTITPRRSDSVHSVTPFDVVEQAPRIGCVLTRSCSPSKDGELAFSESWIGGVVREADTAPTLRVLEFIGMERGHEPHGNDDAYFKERVRLEPAL